GYPDWLEAFGGRAALAAAAAHALIHAMRLMLIDDDPRYRTLLRHHISCDWPDVELVSYNPRVRGPLTPGFLAQGYSVVLLDHEWRGGSGLDWLRDFAGREGFA